MDEAMIERLEESFALLAPRGEEVVARFYAHLFSEHPAVRALFPLGMADQKKKLLASLVLVVKNLRSPDQLRGALVELGRRHAGYGAQAEHYPIVRDALVGVMAEVGGSQWNDQLTADWNAALDLVASLMLEGQALEATAVPEPAE